MKKVFKKHSCDLKNEIDCEEELEEEGSNLEEAEEIFGEE